MLVKVQRLDCVALSTLTPQPLSLRARGAEQVIANYYQLVLGKVVARS